jgi:hypothetical protein
MFLDAFNMYALAALEPGRAQVQVLHNHDPCCYSAQHLHAEIKDYNAFIHGLAGIKGWCVTPPSTRKLYFGTI